MAQKDKGEYSGGRPRKDIDPARLKVIVKAGLSVRKATTAYNAGLPRKSWVSKSRLASALAAYGAPVDNDCPEKIEQIPHSKIPANQASGKEVLNGQVERLFQNSFYSKVMGNVKGWGIISVK